MHSTSLIIYEHSHHAHLVSIGLATPIEYRINHVIVCAEPVAEEETSNYDEVVDPALFLLDPLRWRQQDHYAVMGLSKLRWRATDADIKAAYRQRITRFHPDKLAGVTNDSSMPKNDNFFKCIQRAWTVLTDPDKRLAYDSIDQFDDRIPSVDPIKTMDWERFKKTFAPVFARNARFSRQQPMPLLGEEGDDRATVDSFYRRWQNFDSWRRFDFAIEKAQSADDTGAENRADKRWQEKQQKAELARLKAEDNKRLSRLVDSAIRLDPRLARFREQAAREKQEKQAARNQALKDRETAERRAKEEEAARLAAEKAAAETARKAALAEEEAMKRACDGLRQLARDRSFFAENSGDFKTIEETAVDLEIVIPRTDRVALEQLCSKLAALDLAGARKVLAEAAAPFKVVVQKEEKKEESSNVAEPAEEQFSVKEVDLIIKACKQFPGGAANRWEQISLWVNRHLRNMNLPERDSEAIQRYALRLRHAQESESVLDKAGWDGRRKRDPRVDASEPTILVREGKAVPSVIATEASEEWSVAEQKALEQAMRTHPASECSDRWALIAQTVGTRSKKECMLRAKEIALALKAKQAKQ